MMIEYSKALHIKMLRFYLERMSMGWDKTESYNDPCFHYLFHF